MFIELAEENGGGMFPKLLVLLIAYALIKESVGEMVWPMAGVHETYIFHHASKPFFPHIPFQQRSVFGMNNEETLLPSPQSRWTAQGSFASWPVSKSGLPVRMQMSELEYFQQLIKGFSGMLKDEEHHFRSGTKARFWLQNAKLRIANVHMQRLKLLDLQEKMAVVPKDKPELDQLLQTIELVHPALKEYGNSLFLFRTFSALKNTAAAQSAFRTED